MQPEHFEKESCRNAKFPQPAVDSRTSLQPAPDGNIAGQLHYQDPPRLQRSAELTDVGFDRLLLGDVLQYQCAIYEVEVSGGKGKCIRTM